MRGERRPVVYRSCAPVVDARYDQETDESIVFALVNALAEAQEVDPTDLPPLYDVIDPDALTNLLDRHGKEVDLNIVIGFRLGTWKVFVRADGRIRICDGTQVTDPAPVFETTTA